MKINESIREEVARQVSGLMTDHKGRLQSAFDLNSQELEIAFKVVIKSENPAMDVKTDISYLPEPKVKDSAHGRIAPMPLFDGNYMVCPARDGDQMSENYCADKCEFRREFVGAYDPIFNNETPWQHRSCSAWADHDCHAHIFTMLQWEPPEMVDPYGGIMTMDGTVPPDPLPGDSAPKANVYPLKKKRGKA